MDASPAPATAGFRAPRLCLPRPGTDLSRWAVVACDQHLVFPEVYLGRDDAAARIARIQQTMQRYLADGLLRDHDGPVLVERTLDAAGRRVRRGLMLELDLECYDFSRDSTSLVRPTEGTIVERLAPRIEVRRAAPLELPHILVLIDDPGHTVIEPLARRREALQPLYDTALMMGGGRVSGHAPAPEAASDAMRALQALARPQAFEARYGVPAGTPPMLFAVGDGNHSLATAKSIWSQLRDTAGPDHPARWALVEVENIHDPALDFEPIHRLLFGVSEDLRAFLSQALGPRLRIRDLPSAGALREEVGRAGDAVQRAGLVEPGGRFAVLEIVDPPSTLAVGSLQPLVDAFVARGGAREIDYVHGDDVLERLAMREGCIGLHLPGLDKGELLRMVVKEGPLPRKTFSMGEAHEKRFYMEARRIR
jgi:hypothetical protein